MIAATAPAKNSVMDRFHPVLNTLDWLAANTEALILGMLVAAVLVAIMLALRIYGRKVVANEGEHIGWKSVIGRVLAKTTFLFMIAAAFDTVTTYAEPGPRISRLVDSALPAHVEAGLLLTGRYLSAEEHHVTARRLGLSRATYFRKLRTAP